MIDIPRNSGDLDICIKYAEDIIASQFVTSQDNNWSQMRFAQYNDIESLIGQGLCYSTIYFKEGTDLFIQKSIEIRNTITDLVCARLSNSLDLSCIAHWEIDVLNRLVGLHLKTQKKISQPLVHSCTFLFSILEGDDSLLTNWKTKSSLMWLATHIWLENGDDKFSDFVNKGCEDFESCLFNGSLNKAAFNSNSGLYDTFEVMGILNKVYESACFLNNRNCQKLIEGAANKLLRRFEYKKSLFQKYINKNWCNSGGLICVIGNLQLGKLWLNIYEQINDVRYLNSLLNLISNIKDYMSLADKEFRKIQKIQTSIRIKFLESFISLFTFIDVLQNANSCLEDLQISSSQISPNRNWEIQNSGVGALLLEERSSPTKQPLKLVILTGDKSKTFGLVVSYLIKYEIEISGVLIASSKKKKPTNEQIQARKPTSSNDFINDAWYPGWPEKNDFDRNALEEPGDIVQKCNIPYWEVSDANSQRTSNLLEKLCPDIGVLTGMGIIREPLLSIPLIGFLNAHNGILPNYRGMDAIGWAMLENAPIGCTVHLVDKGVDTGAIMGTQEVPLNTPQELKRNVKVVQAELLTKAIMYLAKNRKKIDAIPQNHSNAKQYYCMHPQIKYCVNIRSKNLFQTL